MERNSVAQKDYDLSGLHSLVIDPGLEHRSDVLDFSHYCSQTHNNFTVSCQKEARL